MPTTKQHHSRRWRGLLSPRPTPRKPRHLVLRWRRPLQAVGGFNMQPGTASRHILPANVSLDSGPITYADRLRLSLPPAPRNAPVTAESPQTVAPAAAVENNSSSTAAATSSTNGTAAAGEASGTKSSAAEAANSASDRPVRRSATPKAGHLPD